jgi:hypothetical protein
VDKQTKRSAAWKPGQSGNPAGRPKGIPNPQARLRKLIDVEALIRRLSESAAKGNTRAAELLLDRALPPLRAVAEPVQMPGLADAATLTEKAEAVVALAADGQLSPDVATAMLTAIGQLAKAAEIDELARRIAALEEAHGQPT